LGFGVAKLPMGRDGAASLVGADIAVGQRRQVGETNEVVGSPGRG
jgi:hypothetical protein